MKNIDTKFAEELVNEHNKIRKDPQIYITPLKRLFSIIRKNNILPMNNERPFKTIEGKDSILDAINYLASIPKEKIKTLSKNPIKLSNELNQVSMEHAIDIGAEGATSHITKNGLRLNVRVEKFCDWMGGVAESLDFGTINVQNIMLKLLICDGDKDRKQREYIFHPGFSFLGAAHYAHLKYRRCNVITYAGLIIPKKADLSEREILQNYLFIHNNFFSDNIEENESSLSLKNDRPNLGDKVIERDGIKIKQTLFKIKKGKFHILEEEVEDDKK